MVSAYSFFDSQITVLSSSATFQGRILRSKRRDHQMIFGAWIYPNRDFLGWDNLDWRSTASAASARMCPPRCSKLQDEEKIRCMSIYKRPVSMFLGVIYLKFWWKISKLGVSAVKNPKDFIWGGGVKIFAPFWSSPTLPRRLGTTSQQG